MTELAGTALLLVLLNAAPAESAAPRPTLARAAPVTASQDRPSHAPPIGRAVQEPARPVLPATDAWFGTDKLQHFWMSYATTAFTFAAARAAGLDARAGLAVAVPAAAAAGVGKELLDRKRGGPFSVKDLVADALGVGAAYFLLREVR
jgi:uncharacterized protein YfiM (DUF2279 family)